MIGFNLLFAHDHLISKFTQLLLILTFSLSPLLNAVLNVVQAEQINPATEMSIAEFAQSPSEDCCLSKPGAICDLASECCSLCFAAMINHPVDLAIAAQALYVCQAQSRSSGIQSEPLIRPPKS